MIGSPIASLTRVLPCARPLASLACAALLGLSFSSCAKYASLKEQTPLFKPTATTAGSALAKEVKTLEAALQEQNQQPREAIGKYLDVAHAASLILKRNPKDTEALAAYNYALSRAFGVLYEVREDPWAQPLEFPGLAGRWFVVARPDKRPNWKPSLFKFQPADELQLSGKYVADRKTKPGLGAPLIATNRTDDVVRNDQFATRTICYGVTAIVRFKGNQCEVSFEDPLATETVEFQGSRFPLAADFTAPLAMLLVNAKPEKLELARLLNPGKYAETARMARLQPYDPKKIPIVCVHGLKDSPATWVPLVNALRTDPVIRQHYQVWFYSYPSGYPYPHSAAIFRKQMDDIRAAYPDHKDVVLIGHSMGGVISRAMITDAGDAIWKSMINRPPDQIVGLDQGSKQILRDALIFDARDDVARAIFIAAPHRGSELASNWVGRLGARLVRAPSTLVGVGNQLKNVMTLDAAAVNFERMPNSVDTLSPDNRFVKAINQLPIAPGIPYHSIMGDRGKGGNKDRTKPVSSDGIVPYWSSHLEGAQSELIVPSNHSAHQNPQAIEEVRRILQQHVGR